ncbi:hypothetical protein RRG08_030601 [Elysia crispata]|uniref:Uncharacterized protein n=1 Tax=Elysia crispata TaxID=231223 RepID=A0AAE1CS85_9GAST|nr:hypothetical protein RRG08_030601 [Elysia crispata]
MCGEPIAERTSHPQTLNVEDILYDDNFQGMKDHFLMCGRGRRPALPSLPLLNNQAYETQRVRLKQVNDSSDNLTEIFNLFFILRRSPATD